MYNIASGSVPADCKQDSLIPIQKKILREGNNRIVSLTSVIDKVTEKIILGDIDILGLSSKATIIHNQYRFIKVTSCLSKLISHYDKVTYIVNKRKMVNAIFMDSF